MNRISRAMRDWGPLGVTTFAAVIVVFLAFAYFVARPPVQDVIIPSGPEIPPELADHQERGGLERGQSVGATPNKALPRPASLFESRGISYTFHESPNWSGRGTCYPQAVVLHVTGPGTMAGMASWFKNPASQVSAHFGIGKNGEIHQYVEMGDSAWHAGIFNRPNLNNRLISEWYYGGINPNRCTIGIELLLAGPAEPLVEYPKMQASLDLLLDFILTTTGIPGDRIHVIGHYEIDSVNRSTDPRCCLSIDDVLNKAPVASCEPNRTLNADGLYWDHCQNRWVNASGWTFDPVTMIWARPNGQPEWGACDLSWMGCWNIGVNRWVNRDAALFDPVDGSWSRPPLPR